MKFPRQLDLFAFARRRDPPTSHDAAASMQDAGERLMWQVAKHLRKCDWIGATAEETSDALGVDKQSITPRFTTLIQRGILLETGVKRRNRSKRYAVVRRHRDFRYEQTPPGRPIDNEAKD